MRGAGQSWHRIAAALNAEGVPTLSGRGRWSAASAMRHTNPEVHNAYMRALRRGQLTGRRGMPAVGTPRKFG